MRRGHPWIGLETYLRQRRQRGLATPARSAVQKAIRDGRIKKAVVFVNGSPKIASPWIADRELSSLRPRRSAYHHLNELEKQRVASEGMSRIAIMRCAFCLVQIAERDLASHRCRCPGSPAVARKEPCP